MALVYENRVTPAFTNKVIDISKKLSIDPNWLMQLMKAESGLSSTISNPYGGAVGLIQFMPDTAKHLGTSTAALKAMSPVQQLDYVYKYFYPFKGRIRSYYDLYLINFFPAAIGKPDTWVFETKKLSASTIAKQNPAININKDGKITIAEFKQYLKNTVEPMYRNLVFTVSKPGGGFSLLLITIIAVSSIYFLK